MKRQILVERCDDTVECFNSETSKLESQIDALLVHIANVADRIKYGKNNRNNSHAPRT